MIKKDRDISTLAEIVSAENATKKIGRQTYFFWETASPLAQKKC